MNGLILLILFIGSLMIIVGLYEEKLRIAQESKKIEYRFIPRTYYEEQMSYANLFDKVGDMFDNPDPWNDRNIYSSDKKDRNDTDMEKKLI